MYLSRLRRFSLLVTGLALLPAPAGALITVGSLDLYNPGTAVVVEDGLAYIGAYGGLFIVDVSNPSAPVEIGAINYWLPDRWIVVHDVVVEGGLAYLAFEGTRGYPRQQIGGLRVVDVSDPTAPVDIGVFEDSIQANGLAVVDNLAYLTVWDNPQPPGGPPPYPEIEPPGLRVIDVANPAALVQVGNVEFLSGPIQSYSYPTEVEVVGDLAYIADFYAGLRTVDVSDPTTPVEIDLAASSARLPNSLSVVDGLAYVTSYRGGLSVFDLSDPRTPIEIGFLQLPYRALDVAVEGETAYVADDEAGLQAIDVSDPEAPVALGRLATSASSAWALTTANGLAYVLNRTRLGDLVIVDLSIPTTPIEVGTTTVSDEAYAPKVAVVGDLAYVTVGEEGIRAIDVSNPAAPVEISAIDTPGYAAGVTGVGSVAYIADDDTGLRIVDFAKPATPVEISVIDTPGSAGAVEVVNGLAYVADWDSGLRVIDVSNPEAPVEIGAIDTLDRAIDVAVVGGLAYVIDYYEGLRIIDVSNPEYPVEIGAFDTLGRTLDIEVSGGRAYLVDGNEDLHIVDVSDPKQPVEIGTFTPYGGDSRCNACAVAVVGETAYLGVRDITAVDVSDPTAPVEAGVFDTSYQSGYVSDLVVAEGLVYAVRHEFQRYPNPSHTSLTPYPPYTSLTIVDFGPEYAPKIGVSIDIKPGSDAGSINPASRGVIPVAILGSDDFDVADIDMTTLTFGPDGATPAHRRGGHAEDVNGDGAMDLVSHFRIQDTGITSETDRACVSGKTLDGVSFEGCGAIRSQP